MILPDGWTDERTVDHGGCPVARELASDRPDHPLRRMG